MNLNPFLSKALIILITVFLLWIFYNIFSLNYKKRLYARVLLVFSLVCYYGVLWLFSDIWYTPSGAPLKCFVSDDSGQIVYRHLKEPGKPQIDLASGRKCIPITTEIRERLMFIENIKSKEGIKKVLNPQEDNFFDPITGKPLLWYERSEQGEFVFYNAPIYSPKTGKFLEPVSPSTFDIYLSWKRKREKIRKEEEVRKRNEDRKKAEEEAKLFKLKEKKAHLEHMRKMLINDSSASKENVIFLDIYADSSTEAKEALRLLLSSLEKMGRVNYPVWNKEFKRRGYWERVKNGNITPAIETGVFKVTSRVVVASLSAACQVWRHNSVGEMQQCQLTLNGGLIDNNGFRKLTFEERGVHVYANEAMQEAAFRLAKRLRNRWREGK